MIVEDKQNMAILDGDKLFFVCFVSLWQLGLLVVGFHPTWCYYILKWKRPPFFIL